MQLTKVSKIETSLLPDEKDLHLPTGDVHFGFKVNIVVNWPSCQGLS